MEDLEDLGGDTWYELDDPIDSRTEGEGQPHRRPITGAEACPSSARPVARATC